MTEKIKAAAKRAFRVIDCQGFALIDFLLTGDNKLYGTKVSTVPGFNKESALTSLLSARGLTYSEILEIMLNNALESKA